VTGSQTKVAGDFRHASGGATERYLLFLVVFFVVFLDLDPPDDFLAVLFFAMALVTSFLRAECKAGKKFRQRFFAARGFFLPCRFPPRGPVRARVAALSECAARLWPRAARA
jgi:hypothetical protein